MELRISLIQKKDWDTLLVINMKLRGWIGRYLYGRKGVVILFILNMTLLPFINYLYGFPIEAVAYGLTIIGVFFLCGFLLDMGFQYRKYREIVRLNHYDGIYEKELPKPSNILEEEYQKHIQGLYMSMHEELKRAEEKNMERLDYFMTWVHQVKTPIAALGLLFQGEDSQMENLSVMKTELFRIEQYADMAMQYIRIEHVENDLEIYEMPLIRVVQACIRKYRTIFIQRKISLELGEISQKVISDEKWLSLIIEQILSNALKYTPAGVIKIYMEADNILVIEDTGMGIRPEDLERVFERGFTGYNGRIDQKASGLGLFLCKKVSGKLQLQIDISSRIQQGTKVRLFFIKDKLEILS
jgi:signal transduction histidine kinase